jgi:hypothetical protein
MSEKENDVTRLLGEPIPVQVVETKEKWSWTKFIVGMLSKQFIAWLAASLILFIASFYHCENRNSYFNSHYCVGRNIYYLDA